MRFQSDRTPTESMKSSLLFTLHSHKLQPDIQADPNRFREVFSTKYGKVRIFKIQSYVPLVLTQLFFNPFVLQSSSHTYVLLTFTSKTVSRKKAKNGFAILPISYATLLVVGFAQDNIHQHWKRSCQVRKTFNN